MFTRSFWRQTIERAIKTFAQAAGALLVGDGIGLLDVDWAKVASVGALAAVASIVSSIVSLPLGEPDSPSAVEQ